MQAVEHPPHQLRKGRHIGPKFCLSKPHQRQGNKKYSGPLIFDWAGAGSCRLRKSRDAMASQIVPSKQGP